MAELSDAQRHEYETDGYVVVPGLFPPALASSLIEHYMAMRAAGPRPGDSGGTNDHPEDPNHEFPRMIDMHRWDPQTTAIAHRTEILDAVARLLGDDPVLNQTMVYFKPPGARGQAMHQDQQYITIDPLVGVWMALDPSDAAVGRLVVLPGSHRLGLQQVMPSDTSTSFTKHQAALPDEAAAEIGLDMQPGDVLFFDGKLIHGSHPNTTADRWRRSFSAHYVGRRSREFDPPAGTHWTHLKSPG